MTSTYIEITTTPVDEIDLGELLLDYDGHGDDAGEAGTYDESGLDDLMRRLKAHVCLPHGWELATETDYDGCRLVARCALTGRTVSHRDDLPG